MAEAQDTLTEIRDLLKEQNDLMREIRNMNAEGAERIRVAQEKNDAILARTERIQDRSEKGLNKSVWLLVGAGLVVVVALWKFFVFPF